MKARVIISIISIAVIAITGCFPVQPELAAPGSKLTSLPPVISFIASPSKIENGAVVTLHWEVSGADRITIDNDIGDVPSSGNREVKPAQITSYNLTASNSSSSVVSSVIVNVLPFIRVSSPVGNDSNTLPGELYNGLPRLSANESYVFHNNAVMVGADDHFIVLRNNPEAHNPTWTELKAFLENDPTDRHAYMPGQFTCGDFAEMLHNNAEAAGIRASIVAIELALKAGGVMNHSLNAFETIDRGLIYIDNTSSTAGFYADKQAHVAVGEEYICVSIFTQPGQLQTWPSMGKIQAVDIFQW